MTIVWISVWAAALLLLPGWVIWRLAGPRGTPPALEIASAFSLSVAIIAMVGWSSFVLGIGFNGVRAVLIVVLVLAALAFPITLRYKWPAAPERAVPTWTMLAALALSLGAGLAALYSGPWLSQTADTFYHLAAVRAVLEHGTALPQEVFFSAPVPAADPTSGAWHLALALVSNFSSQDPVTVWRVINVAVAPITVIAFFTLALSITRSGLAALIACALYTVLGLSFDFRTAAYPNRFGLLLAWLALAFVLRFVQNGSRRELAVAAAIAFAASAVHPLLSPFLMIALACGMAAAILVRSPARMRFAGAAAVVGVAALPLLIVNVLTVAAAPPYAAKAVGSPLLFHVIHHPWSWVSPSFWYGNPGIALGTAFAILLLRQWWAREAGAGLLIVVLLVIPAAALTPLFATTHGGQYLLARVAGVLAPLAWITLGWGLALAIRALRSRLRMPAAAVVVVSAVAMVPGFYTGPVARYVLPASSAKSFASSRSTDLTVIWRDRLAAIDKLPRSAILLAEPRIAYELVGLTDKEVVAVPLSHTPVQIQARDGSQRRESAADAVQGRLDSAGLAGVIEQYGVTDVLVDMDQTDEAAWAQLANAKILSLTASGDRWRLYHYGPEMLDGYLNLPMQDLPGPELARSGIGPQPAFAGRAVFARVQWNQTETGSARLQVDATDSTVSINRTVQLSAAGSTETFALPMPTNAPVGRYRLSLVLSGGRSLALGQFDLGFLYQAEDMGGVVAGDPAGWTILGGSAFLGTLSASATRVGSTTRQAIPPVGAGNYCVGARVYDYGTDQISALEVTVGSAQAQLSWSGAAPGMRWVRTTIALDRPGGQLGMRLIQRGQAAMVVDALELYPRVEGECSSG